MGHRCWRWRLHGANGRKSTTFYKSIIDSMMDLSVCLLFNLCSAGLLLCSQLCGSAGGSWTRGSRNKHRPDYNWCGSQKNHWASVRSVQVSPRWFLCLNWRLFNICDVCQSSSLGIHAELKKTMMECNKNGMRSAERPEYGSLLSLAHFGHRFTTSRIWCLEHPDSNGEKLNVIILKCLKFIINWKLLEHNLK